MSCEFCYFSECNTVLSSPSEFKRALNEVLSVMIGGLFGNYLNLKIFTNRVLALVTSLLVIFVAIRMGMRIFI